MSPRRGTAADSFADFVTLLTISPADDSAGGRKFRVQVDPGGAERQAKLRCFALDEPVAVRDVREVRLHARGDGGACGVRRIPEDDVPREGFRARPGEVVVAEVDEAAAREVPVARSREPGLRVGQTEHVLEVDLRSNRPAIDVLLEGHVGIEKAVLAAEPKSKGVRNAAGELRARRRSCQEKDHHHRRRKDPFHRQAPLFVSHYPKASEFMAETLRIQSLPFPIRGGPMRAGDFFWKSDRGLTTLLLFLVLGLLVVVPLVAAGVLSILFVEVAFSLILLSGVTFGRGRPRGEDRGFPAGGDRDRDEVGAGAVPDRRTETSRHGAVAFRRS